MNNVGKLILSIEIGLIIGLIISFIGFKIHFYFADKKESKHRVESYQKLREWEEKEIPKLTPSENLIDCLIN